MIDTIRQLENALRNLCNLKKLKDEHGKDHHYEQFQPEAWSHAFTALENIPKDIYLPTRYYIHEGMTRICVTNWERPADHHSKEHQDWVDHLRFTKQGLQISEYFERVLEKKGFSDWDELKEEEILLVAESPSQSRD